MDRPSENLAEVLEAIAVGQPAAPLLHLPGRPALTYADLREQIGYVRDRLGDWGIARGDIVAGCIDSRPHMALACATLPSASTFAPLSPSLTEDGYAALLDRLQPAAVLVEGALAHPLRAAAQVRGIAEIRLAPAPAAAFGRFRLDRSATRARGGGKARARADIAYVLVTSGTTGRP
jgi:acyl-CoA synthetase (AMP-forming)/AMP-acid ligase II